MQNIQQSLFMRDDTFLGVCEALGEDLGFHPNILRIALGVLLLWQPVAVVSFYLSAAVIVLASRLLFPSPRISPAAEAAEAPPVAHSKPGAPEPQAEDLFAEAA